MLNIKNLYVSVGGKEILKGINLSMKQGEIHAIMGPNGAGKTTFAQSLMGNPKCNIKFKISNFKYQINGEDMFDKNVEDRARAGLFVAFQNPVEIEGVSIFSFLKASYASIFSQEEFSFLSFKNKINKVLKELLFNEDFIKRFVNKSFSGGEKKRMEILQMLILKPKFAILDEIDSGLDLDFLKKVTKIIKNAVKKYKIGLILITHNPKIFNYLQPDFIHILKDGKIIKSDGLSIIKKIEKEGYDGL